jgi:hypothetical protein
MALPREKAERIRDYWRNILEAARALDKIPKADRTRDNYARLGQLVLKICSNRYQDVNLPNRKPDTMIESHPNGCMGGTMLDVYDSRSFGYMPYKKTVAIGKAFHNYGRGIAPLPNPCTGCIACSVQDPAVCLEQLLDVQRKLHHGKNGAFARMLARVNAGDDSHILQPLEG